ncbi:hypothetical protein AA101099_1469 [Neoasaia chiangmaiensis NBRC 101099]|uniref:PAAR domain-containing protein n=1 Tax=Neoasaia chiangmaiensis TaxID=320497 RepID=UPI00098B74F5|nr:PAAR domain-containing protein [Neoasaia chiangmaiensis]GBR38968.1 hypothetical protein AA101099_1469 [Neoasaia chiangmaiensis NBRC 101099]GEN15613.1 hypothetical protein NCH01_20440 [Neoasaia chiangmaiensis]
MPDARPAARISDMHECPEHVGGPIMLGSPNVFIGGLPAARIGDMGLCVGPEDAIIEGSATVFINGRPAARMGDMTAHGGVIIGGCPTVLIGDGVSFGNGSFPGAPCPRKAAAAGAPFYEPS